MLDTLAQTTTSSGNIVIPLAVGGPGLAALGKVLWDVFKRPQQHNCSMHEALANDIAILKTDVAVVKNDVSWLVNTMKKGS
jgi:hypothetical protein